MESLLINHSQQQQQQQTRIAINRPLFSQSEFDLKYLQKRTGRKKVGDVQDGRRCTSFFKRRCTRRNIKKVLLGIFPVFDHWRTYQFKKWFLYDFIAGLSAGVIHLPQGLGFALLAGVPPEYGLYTSFLPGWIYYIFGTSRHLSYGTMAVLSLMVGSFVSKQNFDSLIVAADLSNTTSLESHLVAASDDALAAGGLLNVTEELLSSVTHLPQFYYFSGTTDTNNNSGYLATATATDRFAGDRLRVNAATMMTLTIGLLQILMWSLKMGVVASFMSLPFVKSFTAGAAVHIAINQFPFLLGFKVSRASGFFQLPVTVYRIATSVRQTNMAALVISVICMTFLLLTKELFNRKMAKRLKFPVPAELIAVVVATAVSYAAQFESRFGVKVIGSIPTGFPMPVLPSIQLLRQDEETSLASSLGNLVSEALPTAIIGFALAITMAKLMAERHDYEVDSNHELLASGLVNAITSFFGCIASTQAPPRSLVLESCGCKSQLAGLLSTLLPFFVVMLAGWLFAALPVCILGSVVAASVLPLVVLEFIDFLPLWKFSRGDFLVWVICFATTVFVDVGSGLLAGLVVSCLVVLAGNKTAKGQLLRKAGSTEIYVNHANFITLKNHDDITTEAESQGILSRNSLTCVTAGIARPADASVLGDKKTERNDPEAASDREDMIAIFRFECSVYFVNAERFKSTLLNCVLKKEKSVGNIPKKGKLRCCCYNHSAINTSNLKVQKPFGDTITPGPTPANQPSSNPAGVKDQNSNVNNSKSSSLLLFPVKYIILDFSRVADIDLTGLNAIKCSIKKLNESSISVSICCCPEKTRRRLEAGGVVSAASRIQWEKPIPLYPSIVDAHAHLKQLIDKSLTSINDVSKDLAQPTYSPKVTDRSS